MTYQGDRTDWRLHCLAADGTHTCCGLPVTTPGVAILSTLTGAPAALACPYCVAEEAAG